MTLRETERKVSEMTDYTIKLVERAGTGLKDLIWKADPWGGPPCPR